MVTCKEVKEILREISLIINKKKLYLSELDTSIGDGDHGLNLSKGFNAVEEKIENISDKDIGNIFEVTGMTLVETVGGASGPLYGTAFMKASTVVNKKSSIDMNDFLQILAEALNGIKIRGEAKEGEKTMIDTLSPVVNELKKDLEEGRDSNYIFEDLKYIARKGMESTRDIIATKGRASYLKERSIGYKDPGATSMYYILDTVFDYILNKMN
ncbi:dihydroxyacetone kinase subunit DhaL [Clostridium sp. SM-530-WT-3G]|uniref:dihydroxyacetone kinase subunit DhaL n=1 Tax=Clostridium sp. SM-530-WT-3G TaxID=2725303 RepID=UPI00145F27A9|nr:dihydroxyacetone kinase subunit DhaL [Clostridium sp. SM-530-WT-3G]NME82231.1 dihydroxyacetone kinase subunit L [Clostridium sp. SM-530-WT-3G]